MSELLVKTRDALACLINQVIDPDKEDDWTISIPHRRKMWILKILDEATQYIDKDQKENEDQS